MKKTLFFLLLLSTAAFGQINRQGNTATEMSNFYGGVKAFKALVLPLSSAETWTPAQAWVHYNTSTNRFEVHNGTSYEAYAKLLDLGNYVTNTAMENTITYLQNYSNPGGGSIATNVKYGDFALYSNTTGYNNAAFGNNALYSNTTGSGNSAFGFNALYATTTGNILTAFGNRAGQDLLSGSRDTFIGGYAGAGFQSGSGNIFLTSGIDPSGIVNGSNNTIIGNPTGLASNTSDTVWLGTTAPAFEKSSAGAVNITGTSFTFNNTPVGIGYEAVRNIKTESSLSSITATGSETALKTVTILANTIDEGYIIIDVILSKTGTANTILWKIYKNTSNTLTGATQIATYTGTASNLTAFFHREFTLRGTGIYGYNFSGPLLSDDTATSSAAIQGTTFNRAVDNYLFITAQLTDTSDTATVSGYNVKFSKSN